MKETRKMHKIWKEMASLSKKTRDEFNEKFPSMLGKWYYYYENKNGKIGLARINDVFLMDMMGQKKACHYEACGHLDYEKFKTKKAAEIAIYKALGEKYSKGKINSARP